MSAYLSSTGSHAGEKVPQYMHDKRNELWAKVK
jgi:hypothetical protein